MTTAFNFSTMNDYSGSNAALVGNGKYNAFATFNQIRDLGYTVRKGAKSISIFCGYKEKLVDGKNETVPVYARVFDICDTNAEQDPELVKQLKKKLDKQEKSAKVTA
jgi:antirestriction protein ArdC